LIGEKASCSKKLPCNAFYTMISDLDILKKVQISYDYKLM